MNEKRNWWDEHKLVIKTGAACLFVGAFYGFVKGVNCGHRVCAGLIDKIPESTNYSNSFEYSEVNVDDPELLLSVRMNK